MYVATCSELERISCKLEQLILEMLIDLAQAEQAASNSSDIGSKGGKRVGCLVFWREWTNEETHARAGVRVLYPDGFRQRRGGRRCRVTCRLFGMDESLESLPVSLLGLY
jgi:hypothetical protein